MQSHLNLYYPKANHKSSGNVILVLSFIKLNSFIEQDRWLLSNKLLVPAKGR